MEKIVKSHTLKRWRDTYSYAQWSAIFSGNIMGAVFFFFCFFCSRAKWRYLPISMEFIFFYCFFCSCTPMLFFYKNDIISLFFEILFLLFFIILVGVIQKRGLRCIFDQWSKLQFIFDTQVKPKYKSFTKAVTK